MTETINSFLLWTQNIPVDILKCVFFQYLLEVTRGKTICLQAFNRTKCISVSSIHELGTGVSDQQFALALLLTHKNVKHSKGLNSSPLGFCTQIGWFGLVIKWDLLYKKMWGTITETKHKLKEKLVAELKWVPLLSLRTKLKATKICHPLWVRHISAWL